MRFDLALRGLDTLAEHATFDDLAFLHPGDRQQSLGEVRITEDAHQVVFHRQIEARGSRIALATGSAAQLVVDTSRLVTLCADDVQPAGGNHLIVTHQPLGAHALAFLGRGIERQRGKLGLEIAAEHDIGAAPCHIRCNRNCAGHTGLRDDKRLLLMETCIQHRERL